MSFNGMSKLFWNKRYSIVAFFITVFIMGISFLSFNLSSSSFDYDAAWKEVEKIAYPNPKTAIEKIENINQHAEKEKNDIQQLRCILQKGKLKETIEDGAFKKSLAELETFREEVKEPVTRAVADYLLGRIYLSFYSSNRWIFENRTDLVDTIPEDIEEWTKELIFKKVRELQIPAVQLPELKTTKATAFKALFDFAQDDAQYRPTLFDLLMNDMVSEDGVWTTDEKMGMHQKLVEFHQNDSEKSAYTQAKIDWIGAKFDYRAENDSLLLSFEELLEEVKNDESSMLVRAELCKYWMIKENWMNQEPFESEWSKSIHSQIPQKVLTLAEEGVKKYPKHIAAPYLKSVIDKVNQKSVELELTNESVQSGDTLSFKVQYANITDLTLILCKYDGDYWSLAQKNDRSKGELCKEVARYSFSLEKTNYFLKKDTVITIPKPVDEYGYYVVKTNLNEKEDANWIEFSVTDLYCLSFQRTSKKIEYVVVNAKTGEALKNVDLESHYRTLERDAEYSSSKSTKTDADGFAEVKYENRGYYKTIFKNGKDVFHSEKTIGIYGDKETDNGFYHWNNAGERGEIFVDRAIYRPGQTVHFKVVMYDIEKEKSHVLSDKKVSVVLKDSHYQEIAKIELTTNEFGSASSSFVLPESGFLNYCTLVVDGKYDKQIQVEEYKRPTFEVTFEKPTATFMYGDSVTVKGKVEYLMGAPASGAKAKCKVVRMPLLRYFYGASEMVTIAETEIVTDDEGMFNVSFFAEKRKDISDPFYRYIVSAEVTDENGETQQGETDVYVGERSILFSQKLEERLTFDKFSTFKFRVGKLDGSGLTNQKVDYEVRREDKTLTKGSQMSDNEGYFSLPIETSKWKSGLYNVILKAKDDKGRESVDTLQTILYRLEDKCPPVYSLMWTEGIKDVSLAEGENYTVRVGSSLKDAHLLVITTDDKTNTKRQWYALSDEIKEFKFALEDSQKESLHVEFYLVHDGKLSSGKMTISRKRESMKMPVSLSVFRDKVEPGSKESWTITVPKKYDAEVLAAMYDASLDQFGKLEWAFTPEYQSSVSFNDWRSVANHIDENLYYAAAVNSRDFYLRFGRWIDMMRGQLERERGFGMRLKNKCMLASTMAMTESADESVAIENEVGNSANVIEMPTEGMAMISTDSKAAANLLDNANNRESASNQEKFNVRSNFAETAFFYPQLRADSAGNTTINFEMPESLTRWNFLALGHTKDLHYGMVEQQIVSQKDFTISPNLPRFFRKNDKISLTAKIVNLSDLEQTGVAKIQFLDPITEKVIAEHSTDFAVEQGKNGVVSVKFDIPENYDAILVRTIAQATNFKDGEQKLVPVLSDRTVVTQSMPIYVRGGQTKNYTFKNLAENTSKTLRTNFLKLEFSTNPIWYAVQALPSIAEVEHKNANSLSAAHFATVLASHIAKSNPKIFNVINAWKKQGGDSKTLLSQLEKNPEVKAILLSETPWVMDAKSETEMKQRLTTLFDLNDLNGKSEKWLKELSQYQDEDGGYRWFTGMHSNMHTTLFVLDNFGRLKKAGLLEYNQSLEENIENALEYLDVKLEENYNRLKEWDKDYKKHAAVSMYELYYFQVRCMFSEIGNLADSDEAYNFYYGLMKKQWTDFSLLGKSLAAIALYQGGDKDIAKQIVKSLREYSTTSDEMGMYWVKNVSGYLWQDAAISTHTRIMEALALVDYNADEQDNLRLWLLNQKRTQNWDNLIANVDALNVLLLSGSDWVSKENDVQIVVGGQTVETKKEAGTGYFTKVYTGDSVTPKMAEVQLTSAKGGNISWGAMYWQFEENYDKVAKSKNALHIERLIMLQQENNGKKVLKKIDSKTTLKVGDKLVVRITLRTDRDMDYVVLKDQRASCLEPTVQKSGYHCEDGICFYQSPKDAAQYYFFDHLVKGTFVFEYPLWVTHAGDFMTGLATVQCLYAPEFLSNSDAVQIHIAK